MNRMKRLRILLVLLAAVCAAALLASRLEDRQEEIEATGEVVLELDPDTVTALKWEYGDTALAFHKDEAWLYDGDEAFPVDQEEIGALLAPFQSFGVSFTIEDVEDYGLYGLEDPVCTIVLSTEDGDRTVTLGDFSELDGERYVSIGDGRVYLAKSDPLETYDVALSDLIDQDESLSYDEISAIRFSGAEDYTISYTEDSTDAWFEDDVYFTEDSGQTVPLDTDRVESYLENLTTLSLTDYVTYNVTEEELASYGLDDPELTVEVDYTGTDGDGAAVSGTYVLALARDAAELAAAEAAEEAGEEPEEVTGYVRIGDSQIVYRVSEDVCDGLLAASYDDLRHRQILRADFDAVTALDITLEGTAYTLAADGSEDEDGDRIWTCDGTQVDLDALQSALEDLGADSAGDFSLEGEPGREEIRLTVHLDSETRPETEIVLYRYDGSDCVAQVDGEIVCLVSRAAVVDLIEAVHAIVLDR